MTRRLMMGAGGAGSVVVPTDPPDSGVDPEPPDSIWAGWASTSDPLLQTFRPHGRRVAVRSVGITGATHSDHNTAASAAKDAALQFGLGGKGFWDGQGPDYRYDVLFGPGIYNGEMGGGQWGCYVGTTGDPADVILQADGGSNGTLHSFGSQYLEGMTLRAYTTDGELSPKYPWHITGGPVVVAANCVFDVRDAISGFSEFGNRTGAVIGKDSSVLTLFYNCTFKATPGTADFFNMHGTPLPADLPETMVFINCTTEGIRAMGGTGNYSLTGEKSRLFVIGLTHDEHMTYIETDANTEIHTDSDLPVVGVNAGVFRNASAPEIIDGLLPEIADYFYPSSLLDPSPVDQTVEVTDAAPMAPVPGRVYFTRIPQPEALRARASGFECTTAAGQYGISFLPADTPYIRDESPNPEPIAINTTLTTGTVVKEHFYAYTRYPGDNGIWTKVSFDNAAARVMGSTSLPGITDCAYSDDGTTLVPVEAGTPHPVTFLRGN